MARRPDWRRLAPHVIYRGYPEADLLPIEPPKSTELIDSFKRRAEDAGDTLFLFLCREASDDCGDADEYVRRLDRAIRDIESVQGALRPHCRAAPRVSGTTDACVSHQGDGQSGRVIRLELGKEWIELRLSAPDAAGQVSGRLVSNLRSDCDDDDRFNAAMNAVEALVLAHGCAGLDVRDPRYVQGIRTCLEACAAHL